MIALNVKKTIDFLFGVKFYALFSNFHFKFTFHILRVEKNI
jgi:hypothetical protein